MLQEGKYYFAKGELVKVLWVDSSTDFGNVWNFDKGCEVPVYLPGAEKVLLPAMKIGQVARILDCHPDTIRKWEARGVIERQRSWTIGKGRTWRFYSMSDVKNIRDAASEIHRGRPRKDKRTRNQIPSKGSTDKILNEMLRRNSA